MEEFEGLAASLAVGDIGIYPQASVDADGVKTERTEWQNGWNECAISITKKAEKIVDWLGGLPPRIVELIGTETLRVHVHAEEPKLYVLCNDLFYWACSDGEDFELSDLPDLEKALEESPKCGDILWCCRQREMRPQKPYYKYFSEDDVSLFDACGPERDE